MSSAARITAIEFISFALQIPNVGTDRTGAGVRFVPGAGDEQLRFAVKVHTDAGVVGEYVPPRARARMVMRAAEFLAPRLLGKALHERERHYRALRQATKHVGEVGIGVLDIALWDAAGKLIDQPIYRMLGGYRERLPAYASTLHGDAEAGGLSSVEAYADFAEHCLELGYPAYKMHGWNSGRPEVEGQMIATVAERMEGRMDIMYDAGCHLASFHDAVRVGRVCDDHRLFWYEDPYADGGVSAFAHRRMKEFVKTPILITEHVRNPETGMDVMLNGATDFARADPDYDGGITGCWKLAQAADALGMDTEVHACGPAMRQLMAACPKSNYYEVNLVHPVIGNAWSLPVYTCGYSDELDCVDADGCVPVPDGPGLGVSYDWDYIARHQRERIVID
ncbi:MAG: enolase C-terminal domain-like protein [Pseudomonadota bacterium]